MLAPKQIIMYYVVQPKQFVLVTDNKEGRTEMDRYERLYATVTGLLLCGIGWCIIAQSADALHVCAGLAGLVVAHFALGYVNGGR